MKKSGNKLNNVYKLLLLVIVMLSAISLMGEFHIGDWTARKTDLISDLVKPESETDFFPDDSIFIIHQPPIADTIVPVKTAKNDTVSRAREIIPPPANFRISSNTGIDAGILKAFEDSIRQHAVIVPVEDFSEEGEALYFFYDALIHREELNRPVRIAFLGDSFIEGDILTSDLREYLQELYGGRGVGFIPLAPIDRYRNTINIDHEGWKTLSAINLGQKGKYLFNGQCFIPQGTAYTGIRTTDSREHNRNFDTASLLYINEGEAKLRYGWGRSEKNEVELPQGESLRLHTIDREDMRSGEFHILGNADFTGYGLFLNDNTGVCVDNYSLRSSSGLQLSRISTHMLSQLNRLIPYDLIILQYGMNVVEPDRKAYSVYEENMVKILSQLKEALPHTSFLIMGVGDRNYRSETGEMVTKIGVINLIEAQRSIARQTKVAFWNTYIAMGGRNSMTTFVTHSPPMANKDYTHINYHGGRRIAHAFGESLIDAKQRYE